MGSPHEDDQKSMYTSYNAIILLLYTRLLLLLCLQSYCSASNINFIVVILYIHTVYPRERGPMGGATKLHCMGQSVRCVHSAVG